MHDEDVCVRSGDRERTVKKVIERARRLGSALLDRGLQPGDRYCIVMRNEISFLEANYAAAAAGLNPVPVNWHWTGDDLRHVLHNSEAKAVIVHSDLLPAVEKHRPGAMDVIEVEVPPEIIAAYDLPVIPLSGRHPTLEQLVAVSDPIGPELPAPPMGVIYTSGTTGKPKGIQRDHVSDECLSNMFERQRRLFRMGAGRPTVCPAPLYHSAPNKFAMFALAVGMEITIMPRFDAEDFLRIVEEHQVVAAQMVPTMFQRMLKLPALVRESYNVSSLETVVHAAAPCPVALKESMIEWFGPIIVEFYGGSEGGAWTVVTSEESLKRPGTVGRAVPGATIKILGADNQWVDPGEVGVIYGKNPGSIPEFTYIGQDDKRREIEVDGFITVGDVGYVDDEGYLFLSDRASDMVISGGVNIYPAEIESVLYQMPQVEDAAVFGIPDDEYGEKLVAHIQAVAEARVDESKVRDFLGNHLAKYKIPRVIVFDSNLPREDSGKLFKRRIKQAYLERV